MNKNTKRLIFSIILLIITVTITAVLGNMPAKNGLDSLEKAGWFAMFFIITIVVTLVVIVNIVICLVSGEHRRIHTGYSYVMGISNSIYSLLDKGFVIEQDGDNYMVSFPVEKASIWESYIKEYLEVGYWNEYIAYDKVVFLFHLEDGFKRYEVMNFENDEVLKLCEKLCECKFESLMSMLMENHLYKKVLK